MHAISQSLSLWPLDIFVSGFLNWFHCASFKSINNKSKKTNKKKHTQKNCALKQ